MNLAENLHFLRKRDKITQEELADRLGVSRQSVSKWETGEAYPETDKLISICDIFGVTLDALLRTDLTAEELKPKTDGCPEFAAHMDEFSRAIAVGVFLIIFGVAICVALAGSGMAFTAFGPIADILSVVAVLAAVAVAIFLFIFYGIKHDRFRKEYPEIESVIGEEQIKAFNKKFGLMMAILVTGIIVDVIFIVLMSSFIDADIIRTEHKDGAYCFVTAAFLLVISFSVGGLTYYGIQRSKYDVSEYNRQTKRELNPSPRSKLKDALCGAVMLTATALFLVLGFVGGWWHPAWVVFPVGGIICAIIGTVMNAKDDH